VCVFIYLKLLSPLHQHSRASDPGDEMTVCACEHAQSVCTDGGRRKKIKISFTSVNAEKKKKRDYDDDDDEWRDNFIEKKKVAGTLGCVDMSRGA
jgi:hypothetical protein